METAEVLSEVDGGYCVNRMARKSAAIHLSEVTSTFKYIFLNGKLDFQGQTAPAKKVTQLTYYKKRMWKDM